jgi:hypothetical protein
MGPSHIILGMVILIKKMMYNKFMDDLLLFVAKAYMPIFVVENQWLKHLVICQNLQVVFPNHKQMVQHAILSLVVKTMEH